MTSLLRYISHPEVQIDASVPVTRWHLSERGFERARLLLRQPWLAAVGRIVSSPETKALDTATLLASHLDLTVEVRDDTGEIDRSSTGFVPAEHHERLADEFFADPTRSASGWERAVDAQARIVAGLGDLLDEPSDADTVVVGHGAVGTLWYCWLTDQPIARRHDQPGQGHYLTVDVASRRPLHWWRAVDDLVDPPR